VELCTWIYSLTRYKTIVRKYLSLCIGGHIGFTWNWRIWKILGYSKHIWIFEVMRVHRFFLKKKEDHQFFFGIKKRGALTSCIYKVLDWVILIMYEPCFKTSYLQFAYKTGLSTTMCTLTLKEVVSYYNKHQYQCLLRISWCFKSIWSCSLW